MWDTISPSHEHHKKRQVSSPRSPRLHAQPSGGDKRAVQGADPSSELRGSATWYTEGEVGMTPPSDRRLGRQVATLRTFATSLHST